MQPAVHDTLLPESSPAAPPVSDPAAPIALVSVEHLLAMSSDLTAIRLHTGWRSSATQGSADALDYVTQMLREFDWLADSGISTWDYVARMDSAKLVWDVDVFSPAQSCNLIGRAARWVLIENPVGVPIVPSGRSC